MTEMKPGEIQISNLLRRAKQREQLERAFERYKKSQSQPPVLTVPQSAASQSPSFLPAVLGPSFSSQEHPTDDLHSTTRAGAVPETCSPPLLTFEGATPADLDPSVMTPISQDTAQPSIANDETRRPNVPTVPYEENGNDKFPQDPPTESAKRRVPSEFDETTNLISKKFSKQRPTPLTEQEESWTNPIPRHTLVDQVEGLSGSHRHMSGLEPVQELDEAVTPETRVNQVEDEMGVPRGFIAFVKYGLTKSRLSVQSMISASGTIASRFSSRRSSRKLSVDLSPPQGSDSLFHGPHMSNSTQPQLAHNSPVGLKEGRQETDLFLELRLAGAPDAEVAARLRQLLKGCGPKAQSVVNARNSRREIPLEVALSLGNIPACDVLLEFGADVRSRTSDGKSLTEFGRIALCNTSHTPTYIAIGACRNKILGHARDGEEKQQPRKTENIEMNPSPTGDQDLERANHNTVSGFGSAGTAPPSSRWLGRGRRGGGSLSSTSMNRDSTQSHPNSPMIPTRLGSKSDLSSQVTAGYQPSMSSRLSVSSQQTQTPDVSNLVDFYNSVSQHQPRQVTQITHSPEGNRPPTQLWNSYFPAEGATGLPALTSLGGGSATLDMALGFDISGGHYELLPDGRMAFIMPSDGNMEPLAAVRSATYAPLANPSRRAGGFFQMITPLQFQAQNATGWSSQVNGWSSTNFLTSDPVQTSYSDTSVPAFLNSLEFQDTQIPSFENVVPGMDTQLPIPPGPSATYGPQGNQVYSNNLEAIAPIDLWDTSSHLPSTLQQNGPAMNPSLSDIFGAELEADQPEHPLTANFVPGWNYRSPFY
jgi:hypothetical protein